MFKLLVILSLGLFVKRSAKLGSIKIKKSYI